MFRKLAYTSNFWEVFVTDTIAEISVLGMRQEDYMNEVVF